MPKQTNIGTSIRQLNTMANQFTTQLSKLQNNYKSQHGTGSGNMASRTKTATRKGKGKARGRWGSGNRQGGTGNRASAASTF